MPRARLILALLACSCAGTASRAALEHESVRDAAESRELFEGWDAGSTIEFEQRLAELAAGPSAAWSDAARAELARALDFMDSRSVRAAVLLSHDPSPEAERVLLARLERRVKAPTRPADAGDLVAAAALTGRGVRRGVPERLEVLAIGDAPHPDLEVRVECAAAALWSGRDAVAPFLVRVLRALTPAERGDPPDWEPVRTVAWAKTRAAEALCRRLGRPVTFRPDGSWAHQIDEAAQLAAAFAELRDQ